MIDNPSQNPPPGWYPDPQSPQMLRWWNGGEWTNDVRPADSMAAPIGAPASGGMRPISDWMTESFRLIINNAGSLFTLAVILLIPAALISAVAIWFGIRDLVLIVDEQNSAEPFRIEGAESLPVAGLGLAANLLFTFLFAICATRLALSGRFGPAMSWEDSLGSGLRRLLPSIGWTLVGGFVLVVAFAILLAVSALLGPFGVLVGIILFLALFTFGFGRYAMAFTTPYVAASGSRNPLAVHRATRGHTAGTTGRTFLLFLIAVTASLAGSFVTGPVAALGGAEPVEAGDTVFRIADILGGNLGLFLLTTLVNSIIGAVATLLWHVGQASMFEDFGGQMDPELRESRETVATQGSAF